MRWVITLSLVVALVARGIHLGRPITVPHAAAAALLLLGACEAYLLSWTPADLALIVGAAAAIASPTASRPDRAALQDVWTLICHTHGDPLAPFAMNRQKTYFFNDGASAAIAYRTRLGLAVVSGDPVGEGSDFGGLVDDFSAMCRTRGWRIVVLGCSADRLGLWRDAGVIHPAPYARPIGCDVEIDVPGFGTSGRRFRNLRQAVARTHNRGITTELVAEQELDTALAAELAEVLHASHRSARLERGFSMILDSALEGRYPGVLLMVGRDNAGRVQGFHRYLIAGAGSDVTLDVPWRLPGAPNGLDERLTVDMISWCKAAGTQRLSLSFAAFPDLFDNPDRNVSEAVYYRLITLGGPLIRLEPLYRYLRKFNALGRRRYVLLAPRHIPLALVVLLSLEFMPRRRDLTRRWAGGSGG
jgi:lysylphosphatidylglycerol synthetase-like protein (DUF2156 family)